MLVDLLAGVLEDLGLAWFGVVPQLEHVSVRSLVHAVLFGVLVSEELVGILLECQEG